MTEITTGAMADADSFGFPRYLWVAMADLVEALPVALAVSEAACLVAVAAADRGKSQMRCSCTNGEPAQLDTIMKKKPAGEVI